MRQPEHLMPNRIRIEHNRTELAKLLGNDGFTGRNAAKKAKGFHATSKNLNLP